MPTTPRTKTLQSTSATAAAPPNRRRPPQSERVKVMVSDELLDAELTKLARELLGDGPGPKLTPKPTPKAKARAAAPSRIRRI